MYPVIDGAKCTDCGKCVRTCPVVNNARPKSIAVGYAAYNTDEKQLKESSSGGVFSVLAEHLLNKGGVVFGAVYGDGLKVVHQKITTKEDLALARGSKYMQSVKGAIYKDVKAQLEKGSYVLFTGCPCEVAGLVAYLGKPYERLLTADLICHGVPPYKVFNSFLSEKKFYSSVNNVAFRDKSVGWGSSVIRYDLAGGRTETEPYADCAFIKGFIGNSYLRRSCYDCSFKGVDRASDLTIADLWGARELVKGENKGGMSLVVAHTDKGNVLLQYLGENGRLNLQEIDVGKAFAHNDSAVQSMPLTAKRKRYFRAAKKHGFSFSLSYSMKSSFFKKAKRKLKSWFKK